MTILDELKYPDISCESCAYWDYQDDSSGLCRFNPPSAETQKLWPTTGNGDWCGQYRRGA